MNHKLLFKTALLAGEIMLRNGAETYRVEDTINRLLSMSNYKVVESFVTPTGIFATLDDPSIDMITVVKRVNNRTIRLDKVAVVNDVSRKFCSNALTLDDAYESLLEIASRPPYSPMVLTLAIALAAGFFSLVFGGSISDFFVAILNGLSVSLLQIYLRQKDVSRFFVDLIASTSIALITVCFTILIPIGNNMDIIIIGSIMPLVPGVAITNAVRDTIQGDLVSGVSRALEAIIVAIAIAVGVGTGLRIFSFFIGGGLL
ncbi:uncharacterized membrane protein YjjP (DUF1212 family) [Natranaerovirga hydrolytica]|uniref:Uncharacterized membrane protein YjjP (DUF1212 family) n=1 Tax=Natranaerovirga hydrolytica TaxID=680378 RepID=A0A4R1MZ68_9FIRM|nr:threonine/serine exporter family protein [Natranaerovirga hydrolytica]TCK98556.1 uncharacterized membrane protein YjjP (DUF1212 family) [Natranaerovirga hydrolytica]